MKPLEVIWLAGAQAEMMTQYARLGDKFYERVHQAVDQLRIMPESAPLYLGRFRRLILPKTPVGLFFSVEGKRLVIFALLDLRMSPARIRERLLQENE